MAETPQADAKTNPPTNPATGAPIDQKDGALPAVEGQSAAENAGASGQADTAKKAFLAKLGSLGGLFKTAAKGAGGSLATIPRVLWAIISGVLSAPFLIFKGDLTDKVLAIGFVASVGLAGYSGMHIYRYLEKKVAARQQSSPKETHRRDFLSDQKDLAKLAANVFMLERFSAALKANQANIHAYEFELFVESDSTETSQVLKDRLPHVRDAVGGVIQNRIYEDLLTDEGKEKLKNDILNTINSEIKKAGGIGKIKRVYFSRFVMG